MKILLIVGVCLLAGPAMAQIYGYSDYSSAADSARQMDQQRQQMDQHNSLSPAERMTYGHD